MHAPDATCAKQPDSKHQHLPTVFSAGACSFLQPVARFIFARLKTCRMHSAPAAGAQQKSPCCCDQANTRSPRLEF
ncbi:hypothetical protein SL1157_0918 [Ruegeria lacuscaerulensis ITI-1157]|nr:hypothetical protein SL1157_0918 [Ruegeria lacuscaerulensis ITI-1157]